MKTEAFATHVAMTNPSHTSWWTVTTQPKSNYGTSQKTGWPHKEDLWPRINIGNILRCGSLEIKAAPSETTTQPGKTLKQNKGPTRLLKILISETAHLIWALRCDRVIRGNEHSMRDIEKHWTTAMNSRLTEDKITTTKYIQKKAYTLLIENTWKPALEKQEGGILPNWMERSKVF